MNTTVHYGLNGIQVGVPDSNEFLLIAYHEKYGWSISRWVWYANRRSWHISPTGWM